MMLKVADMLRILRCMIWFSLGWQRQRQRPRWQRHWRLPSTAPAPLQPRRESTSQVAMNFFTGYSSRQKLWGMRQASDSNSWQSCRGWYWSSGTKNFKFPKKRSYLERAQPRLRLLCKTRPHRRMKLSRRETSFSIFDPLFRDFRQWTWVRTILFLFLLFRCLSGE